MGDLPKRLRASLALDAINGDATERSICARQMMEAAISIEQLTERLAAAEADSEYVHERQIDGVKALQEAVEGGRASTAVVTVPIWLDELRWSIVAELDARDEIIHDTQQRLAAAEGELARVREVREHNDNEFIKELGEHAETITKLLECRRLLREACGSCYDQCLYVDKEWYKAARAAGGRDGI